MEKDEGDGTTETTDVTSLAVGENVEFQTPDDVITAAVQASSGGVWEDSSAFMSRVGTPRKTSGGSVDQETSVGSTSGFKERTSVLARASEAIQATAVTPTETPIQSTWEGDTGLDDLKEAAPTLGGLARPDAAYKYLSKRFGADDLSALTDVVVYEFMRKQAIPGKTFKIGVATLVDLHVRRAIEGIDHRIDSLPRNTGKDEGVRQQLKILEVKFNALEGMLAERSEHDIRILEQATDILARDEMRRVEEGLSGEELLDQQTKRGEIAATLEKLRTQERAISQSVESEKPKRSARRGGLY